MEAIEAEFLELYEAVSGAAVETVTDAAAEVVTSTTCEHCDTYIAYLDAINGLLIRQSQVSEFSLALAISIVFSVICYKVLQPFSKF